jgi:mono/diheme cytochrome c family protein
MHRTSVAATLFVAAIAAGCVQEPADRTVDIAVIDSVLAELGGTSTAAMERGTRWRMIASVGSGLPPTNYNPDDLPEPGSRGAGLLQVYCIQCHWLPSPKMHTADEWDYLIRNMLLRAQTLEYRLGGPLTTGMVGDVVMSGLETAEMPTLEQTDSILVYLRRNAMPEAEPGELTAGPGRELFLQKCAVCHAPPSPRAHTAAGWDAMVARMRGLMGLMDIEPLNDRQADEIAGYLRERSAR